MTARDLQDAQWRKRFYNRIRLVRPECKGARLSYWRAEYLCAKARNDDRGAGAAHRELKLLTTFDLGGVV